MTTLTRHGKAALSLPCVLFLMAQSSALAQVQAGRLVGTVYDQQHAIVAGATVTVAETAVLTASLKPNPVVTVNLFRPDQVLVDAGISPYEQVFRTDYVFERGGKRERRVDQATLSKSVAELQLLNTTRSLLHDVESAFVDVQLAKLNLKLAQDNLQAFNNVVQVNTDRVRAGDLSQVELSRSRLAALQFQNDVRQQDTKVRVARPLGRSGTVKAKVILDLDEAAHTCTDLTAVVDAITEQLEACDEGWKSIGPWPYGPPVVEPLRRSS